MAAEANVRIGFAMSWTTLERAKVVNATWDDAFWQLLKRTVVLDGRVLCITESYIT
jgi:hypothetical protein